MYQIKVKQGHFVIPFLCSHTEFAVDAPQYVVTYDFINMRGLTHKKFITPMFLPSLVSKVDAIVV